MHIKSIIAGAAIALVAGLGSASAAEEFATLQGFQPAAIPATELGSIKGGSDFIMRVRLRNGSLVNVVSLPAEGALATPSTATGKQGVERAVTQTNHIDLLL